MSAAYRFRQFLSAITAGIAAEELDVLDRYLDSAQKQLFLAMDLQDQRHSLDVLRELIQAGYDDRELLQAALLHDVGKAGVGLGTAHRVIIVLLRAIHPGLLELLPSEKHESWRYPFWVHQHHGRLGAELVARAGSNEKLVSLIRNHQSPGQDRLGRALYEADSRH